MDFLQSVKVREVCYKTTNYWNKDCEKSIRWNDEKLAINWPLNKINKNKPLLSTKDKKLQVLKSLINTSIKVKKCIKIL